jgi:hypothetical protein
LISDKGWRRRFDDPIPLPRGRQFVTLEDAGNYITKLPRAEHEAKEWLAAMEALILVATLGDPTMFARIDLPQCSRASICRNSSQVRGTNFSTTYLTREAAARR